MCNQNKLVSIAQKLREKKNETKAKLIKIQMNVENNANKSIKINSNNYIDFLEITIQEMQYTYLL